MYFWLDLCESKSRFLHDEQGQLSYFDLIAKIEHIQLKLPKTKSLVALVARSNIEFVCHYLALLRSKHTILLLDESQQEEYKQALIRLYRANLLIDGAHIEYVANETDSIAPELALLLPTSGSTGSAKYVKLSYDNLDANCKSIGLGLPIVASDTVISSLPLSYSFGLSILNTHLAAGCSVVLTSEGLFSKSFWTQFAHHQISSFYGVPFSFELLLKLGLARLPLKQCRYLAQAGGRLSEHVWQELQSFSKLNQIPMFAMYGQTEATARIAILPPEAFLNESAGTIGTAISKGKLFIEDNAEEGELCYEGPNVFCGYAHSAEDLAALERIALLNTGDVAKATEHGFFKIVGRSKRIAKIQGKRLNLDELENRVKQTLKSDDCVITSDDEFLYFHCVSYQQGWESVISELSGVHARLVKICQVNAIPRLSNGKVDYHGLQ